MSQDVCFTTRTVILLHNHQPHWRLDSPFENRNETKYGKEKICQEDLRQFNTEEILEGNPEESNDHNSKLFTTVQEYIKLTKRFHYSAPNVTDTHVSPSSTGYVYISEKMLRLYPQIKVTPNISCNHLNQCE